jgi:hypothetical protein
VEQGFYDGRLALALEADRVFDFLELYRDQRGVDVAVCIGEGQDFARFDVPPATDEPAGRLGDEEEDGEAPDGGRGSEERGDAPGPCCT